MYKSPIEIVMKEVFQKMNEDFENSVLKAVQKVDINVDKEELLKALIYDRGQYDKGYEDAMNEIKHPQPLKFEDLTPGMWVWDNFFTTFTRLENTYLYSDDALAKETKMTTFYCFFHLFLLHIFVDIVAVVVYTNYVLYSTCKQSCFSYGTSKYDV